MITNIFLSCTHINIWPRPNHVTRVPVKWTAVIKEPHVWITHSSSLRSSCLSFINTNQQLRPDWDKVPFTSSVRPSSQSGQTDFFRGGALGFKEAETVWAKCREVGCLPFVPGRGLAFMSPVKLVSWLAARLTPNRPRVDSLCLRWMWAVHSKHCAL